MKQMLLRKTAAMIIMVIITITTITTITLRTN